MPIQKEMKICHSIPCSIFGKCIWNFPVSLASLCPLLCRTHLLPEQPYSQFQKNPPPPKNQASAIKWLGLGVTEISIFEKLLSQGKVKIGKKCFCVSFSDRATLAHAGFSRSILNGLKLGRGITSQDQMQGELVTALKALLLCLGSTRGFQF